MLGTRATMSKLSFLNTSHGMGYDNLEGPSTQISWQTVPAAMMAIAFGTIYLCVLIPWVLNKPLT